MKTGAPRSISLLLLGLLLTAVFTGCSTAHVKPWERATLSDYTMNPDRDPLANAMR